MKRSEIGTDAGGERVRSSNGLAGARSAEDTRGADARQAQRAVGRARCRRLTCVNCGKRAALSRGLFGWTVKPSCDCNPAAQVDLGCSRSKAMDYFAGTGKRAQARKRDASDPANR